MFGWFKQKRKRQAVAGGVVTTAHPPMVPFPWPKGSVITAVDELVLALPTALFEKDRPMGDFVFGPEDMELNMPLESDTFFLRLRPGMSVSLARSCECYIFAEDKNPRRLSVRLSPVAT